ncbi:hypothetical protein EMN47_14170 [Prolixibacteraceae bacterium JC049]|nr:hypothetical protein [Prolixibacteraceae bacterium JC049]
MKQLKRIIIETHKITGSLLSLLFLVWFISGIVLIFQGFPHASRKERFNHLSTFSLKQLVDVKAPLNSWKGRVEFSFDQDQPVYRVYSSKKAQQVFNAKTLAPITSFSEEHARKLAANFNGNNVKEVEKIKELDQWMPWSYYRPLLPIYKCRMSDEAHTVLYISEKTGEIVQQTNRKKRWMARLGAIPHWIYFKQLRLQKGLWINVVLWLSGIGAIMCFTGLFVGIFRLKKGKGITAYKRWDYKWHHITGYLFGVFVFTFVLSGFFSLADVPNWMVMAKENKVDVRWNQPLNMAMHKESTPASIVSELEKKEGIRKIKWKTIHEEPYYFVYYDNYQIPEVYALRGGSIIKQQSQSISKIESLARSYYGKTPVSVKLQEGYDNYYSGSAMYYLPEKVYKLEVSDSEGTWLYVNPVSGEQVKRYTKATRLRRWLYQGLHKFNFQFLKSEAEWFRILLLLILSVGGIAVSVTGVWLTKFWLKRTVKKIVR